MDLNFLKKPSFLIFASASLVYWLCALTIFAPALPLDKSMIQPDHTMVFPPDQWLVFLKSVWNGGSFIPSDLHWLLGSPYWWAELEYAIPCYLGMLAVAYYLRGRGLSPLAAYGAGLSYSLMGYLFTLFSAGHMGWFEFLSYGIFTFGLIDRALRKGKALTWISLGAVIAWSSARQPDLWMLFTALAFFYGIWGIFRETKSMPAIMRPTRIKSWLLGIVIAFAATMLIGIPQFRHAITSDLESRDNQISSTGGDTAEARWEFATNWSLPPAESLEFVAPRLHGDSSDPRVSTTSLYWGALGRPIEGKFIAGKMMPNYRQHSLYLGAITVLFALIGIASVFLRRKKEYSDVPFWIAALCVCAILSFGRYTPFYRLFYSIPLMDYLRAPVKFHHLTELCMAMLAGFGIEAILSRALNRKSLIFASVLVGAILSVLGCCIISGCPESPEQISALGFGPRLAPQLARLYSSACLQGFLYILLSLVAVICALKFSANFSPFFISTLLVCNAINLTTINSRFCKEVDISFERAPNQLAERILASGDDSALNLAGDRVQSSLVAHGVNPLAPENIADAAFIIVPTAELEKAGSPLGKSLRKLGAAPFENYMATGRGITRASASAQLTLLKVESRPKKQPPETPPLKRALSLMSAALTLAVLASQCGKQFIGSRNAGKLTN